MKNKTTKPRLPPRNQILSVMLARSDELTKRADQASSQQAPPEDAHELWVDPTNDESEGKPMRKDKPLPAHELRTRLERRFAPPEWVVLHEVRNAAGYDASRSADTLAFSTWPSRGCALYGFEIKSSRSDVLKELRDPEKADAIAQYCDRWYLVVGRKDLVSESEVPASWGLLVPFRNGLKIAREAPRRDPKPLPRSFVACLVKRASERRATAKELEDARKKAVRHMRNELGRLKREKAGLEEAVAIFEEELGIPRVIHGWSSHGTIREYAAEIRKILKAGPAQRIATMKQCATTLHQIAEQMLECLEDE